jgi:hypothetical protein
MLAEIEGFDTDCGVEKACNLQSAFFTLQGSPVLDAYLSNQIPHELTLL